MSVSFNMESLKEALTCNICQDIVTLPVHATCCEKAKSMNPACLSCVREYYELNKPPQKRPKLRKSWNGCGCDVKPGLNSASKFYYSHTLQLDNIRNMVGPSKCHHEKCNISFETAAELRRHLTGSARETDKHGNCKFAITKCNYCMFHGERHFVEGEHYQKLHSYTVCDVCNLQVLTCYLRAHYDGHKTKMALLRSKVYDYENSIKK